MSHQCRAVHWFWFRGSYHSDDILRGHKYQWTGDSLQAPCFHTGGVNYGWLFWFGQHRYPPLPSDRMSAQGSASTHLPHIMLAIKCSCFLLHNTLKNTLAFPGIATSSLIRTPPATFYQTAADKILSPLALIPRLSSLRLGSAGKSSALARGFQSLNVTLLAFKFWRKLSLFNMVQIFSLCSLKQSVQVFDACSDYCAPR